jgi:mRNA interferase RelE/StbE
VPHKWRVEFAPKADKQLEKLDATVRKKIVCFLRQLLDNYPSPRTTGTALTGPYERFWRYRVGEYRIVCELQDHKMVVWVVAVGHRREIYRA